MPVSGLEAADTVRMEALTTLKYPEAFAVPTTVIRLSTTGTLPDKILNVNVPVVVTAESLSTEPRVGPVLAFQLPNKYSGVPCTINFGVGLNGDAV